MACANQECKSIFAPTQKACDERMLYIGLFFLNPMSIVLSFASVPGVQSDDILNKVLSFSGGALTNIDRAQIRIKYAPPTVACVRLRLLPVPCANAVSSLSPLSWSISACWV